MTKLLSGKVMVLAALALLLLAAMSAVAVAQAAGSTQGSMLLELATDARAFAMGGVGAALPGQGCGNPAALGIVGYQRVGAGLGTQFGLAGTWDASYVRHGLGLAAAGVEAHGITVYDELGNPTDEIDVREGAAAIAASRKLGWAHVGARLKVGWNYVGDARSIAAGADIGILLARDDLWFGAVVTDVIGGVGEAAVTFGASAQVTPEVTVAADVTVGGPVRLGAEWRRGPLAARCGAVVEDGQLLPSAGVGVEYRGFRIDYGVGLGIVGKTSHRLGLSYSF